MDKISEFLLFNSLLGSFLKFLSPAENYLIIKVSLKQALRNEEYNRLKRKIRGKKLCLGYSIIFLADH